MMDYTDLLLFDIYLLFLFFFSAKLKAAKDMVVEDISVTVRVNTYILWISKDHTMEN